MKVVQFTKCWQPTLGMPMPSPTRLLGLLEPWPHRLGGKGVPSPEAWAAGALGASTEDISVAGVKSKHSLSNVPKGFAAIWNLNPDYSEDDLTRDLAEIDFAQEILNRLGEVKGAFGLCFQEDRQW